MEALQEFVAVFKGEKWVMEINLGNPGHAAQDNVFDTRLRGRRHGDGVAVASEPRRNP